MSDSFYPHGGPKEYSYVSAFYDFREKTGAEAKANTAYNGIGEKGGGIPQVLINLQMLVDGARNAEMTFLADTGIDLTNGNNAKAIFENFNLILNSQQLFARNLAMFKQLSQGVNNKLIDPTKYFYTYLAQTRKYKIIKWWRSHRKSRTISSSTRNGFNNKKIKRHWLIW